MRAELVGKTDIGLNRTGNEDAFLVTKDASSKSWKIPKSEYKVSDIGSVFIVADGMGGEAAGEVASAIAIETISSFLSQSLAKEMSENQITDLLGETLLKAHENIKLHVQNNPESFGMGTTATICLVRNDKLFVAWVGDSRVYRYSKFGRVTNHDYHFGNVEILSNDHSVVWQEVLRGNLTPEQARVAHNSNVITQSLGDIYKTPVPEIAIYDLYQGDLILNCSDGLNGMITDLEINDVLESTSNITILADLLIDAANKGGGKDNITISLFKVIEGPVWLDAVAGKTLDLSKEDPQPVEETVSVPQITDEQSSNPEERTPEVEPVSKAEPIVETKPQKQIENPVVEPNVVEPNVVEPDAVEHRSSKLPYLIPLLFFLAIGSGMYWFYFINGSDDPNDLKGYTKVQTEKVQEVAVEIPEETSAEPRPSATAKANSTDTSVPAKIDSLESSTKSKGDTMNSNGENVARADSLKAEQSIVGNGQKDVSADKTIGTKTKKRKRKPQSKYYNDSDVEEAFKKLNSSISTAKGYLENSYVKNYYQKWISGKKTIIHELKTNEEEWSKVKILSEINQIQESINAALEKVEIEK